jgi:hypothetical protein
MPKLEPLLPYDPFSARAFRPTATERRDAERKIAERAKARAEKRRAEKAAAR